MPTRQVNTDFKVTGEEKLKRAIAEINNGTKVLNSEMRKLTAEYDGNNDSVEFLTQKYDILERQMLSQKDKVEALKQAVADSAEAYGEADSRTQNWIIQLNNAEAALANTYGEMGRTQTAIENMDKSFDEVSDSTGSAAEGVTSLGDVLDTVADKLGVKLPDGISKFTGGLGKIPASTAAAAAGVAAVVAVVIKLEKKLMDVTKETAAAAKELEALSLQTSVSTTDLQAFQYAEDFIGVSSDQLADSLKDLTTKMSDAANGNEETAAKFDQLGVSIYDAQGNLRSSYDVFLDVIDGLGEMSNQAERDALAMSLINESAQKLNPLIEQGSGSLKKYAAEAENVGYILSNDQLKALTDVDEAQNRLLKSQEAVSKQISAEYAPYMSDALNETRELIEEVGTALIDSGAVDAFGSILDSSVSLLEPLGDLTSDILPPLGTLLQGIAGTLAWAADTTNLLVGLLTLNGDRISTALGLNPNKASNIQKALYGADYKTESYYDSTGNYYDPTTGQWTGNYFHNAGGNDNFPGGRTRVGENGPETVYLPQGTVIANAQETRADGGYDAPVNVYIEARTIQEFNDIIEIVRDAQRVRRMKGAPR
nr:MAG TPA: tail tape measure [Caudoviricetes sp.]